MHSISYMYKIGVGPSSSHTMGPKRAAEKFLALHSGVSSYKVTLYGSLAATGKGHMTDKAIIDVLSPVAPTEIEWRSDVFLPFHPNAMTFHAYNANGLEIGSRTYYSVGGGDILEEGQQVSARPEVYELSNITEIKEWCRNSGRSFWEYVDVHEGNTIWEYLREVWQVMKESVQRGIEAEGVLPGGLGVSRKAVSYYVKALGYTGSLKSRGLVYAYALAVSEENAGGGKIVTAPTCGSCGVLPAVLYYIKDKRNLSDMDIAHALGVAGIFGELAKRNASVSGAECGCQAEIGVACAMAAAALGQVFGYSIKKIEYAAEVALEHHLGLTCDPICGLVQIPCIERNAVAAMRALNSANLAYFLADTRRISYDIVVKTMYETGVNMNRGYRETSEGGLARLYSRRG